MGQHADDIIDGFIDQYTGEYTGFDNGYRTGKKRVKKVFSTDTNKLPEAIQSNNIRNRAVFGVMNWLRNVKFNRISTKDSTLHSVIEAYDVTVSKRLTGHTIEQICEEIQKDFPKFKAWVNNNY